MEEDKEAYSKAKMGMAREHVGKVLENPEYLGPTPGMSRPAVEF